MGNCQAPGQITYHIHGNLGSFRSETLVAWRRGFGGMLVCNRVARVVADRDAAGVKPAPVARTWVTAEFLSKIEQ